MVIKGPHEWLRLVVVEEAEDHTDAISPDVFGEFAGDDQNHVTLAREIGGVVLREGDVLEAHGNTKAHDGEQLRESLTDVSRLND